MNNESFKGDEQLDFSLTYPPQEPENPVIEERINCQYCQDGGGPCIYCERGRALIPPKKKKRKS